MRYWHRPLLLLFLVLLIKGQVTAAQSLQAIGDVQGAGPVSPYEGRTVTIEGVVTGRYRSQNSQGRVFHTLYVQAPDGADDDDPQTSRALPVFVGENQVAVTIGDLVRVSGQVKEFFGLTELISSSSQITLLKRNQPLPEPMAWPFPDSPASAEHLEGMLIRYGPARLAGPVHAGCGFALLPQSSVQLHSFRHLETTYDPALLTVQYADELNCTELPALKVGDELESLEGPLNYHFDQWRLLLQDSETLVVQSAALPTLATIELPANTVRLVSINLHNYFDEIRDSDHPAEPIVSRDVQTIRREKMAALVADLLDCPTLIAIQEVENRKLMVSLSRSLTSVCGFEYGIAHEESVDARGIDVALLYDPGLIRIEGVRTRQACSEVPTEVIDPRISCDPGQGPLFSRPPLFVHLLANGQPLQIIVVHLKSKRGGAAETEPIRLAQAQAILGWQQGSPRATVVVGDVNDYRDSATVARLSSGGLINLLGQLPASEQYTFIFNGYAQLLDALLVSQDLLESVESIQIVHTNADYPSAWETLSDHTVSYLAVSDHDIPLLDLSWPPPAAEVMIGTTPSTLLLPENEMTVSREAPEQIPSLVATDSRDARLTQVVTPTSSDVVSRADRRPFWDWFLIVLTAGVSGITIVVLGRRMLSD